MASVSRSRLLDLAKVCRSDPKLKYTHEVSASRPSHSYLNTNVVLVLCIQLQCKIFETTFNPTNQRLGNKVLRQRLKGPALAAYYPRNSATIGDLQNEFKKLGLETWNDYEEDRLESIQIAKMRGKGAPKKKRTAEGESCRILQAAPVHHEVLSLTNFSCLRQQRAARDRKGRKSKKIHENQFADKRRQHCDVPQSPP